MASEEMRTHIRFRKPTDQWVGFLCGRRGKGCEPLPKYEEIEVHPLTSVCILPKGYGGEEPTAVHAVDDVSAGRERAWSIDYSKGDGSCWSGIHWTTEARCVPEGELCVLRADGEFSLWRRVRPWDELFSKPKTAP
jgi:hypothetical protein